MEPDRQAQPVQLPPDQQAPAFANPPPHCAASDGPAPAKAEAAPVDGVVPAVLPDASDAAVGQLVIDYGHVTPAIRPPAACHTCGEQCSPGNPGMDFFKPCQCDRYFHRQCFRQWRQGWINPRNYFACPDCAHSYSIERVREEGPGSDTEERIVRHFHIALAKLWGAMILSIVLCVAVIALIAYFADDSQKNVPVGIRLMLTSVITGWPSSSDIEGWRDDFRDEDTWVWQYYTLLGAFITALIVLVAFVFLGCRFDVEDRPRRPCSAQCCVLYDPCPTTGCFHTTGGRHVGCCCCCCDGHDAGDCCRCGNGCTPGSCDCKLDGLGPAVLIVVLVVIIVVILSAIVLVILFAVRQTLVLHDRMTDMLKNQAAELEGDTVVLGEGEAVRPTDAV